MYVRTLECMSTPLYVYVTHTQPWHTYTHTQHTHLFRSLCMHLLRLCQGEPSCATCAALHRLVTLGTVLVLKVLVCAIICHWENGGVQHLKVGLAAPYFSPSSAQVIQLVVLLPNPSGASASLRVWINLRIRKSLGDCEHARDVVLVQVSITCIARALSVLVSFVLYFYVCANVCTCV